MLHRKYIILVLASFILFSPQASKAVLAEGNVNGSVYDNLNLDKKSIEKDNVEQPPNEDVTDKEEPAQGGSLSVTAFDFIKMFIALAFVLFLVYFLLKFVTKRNRLFQQGQSVMNLGGTSLGQNKSIQVVKVGTRVLVVGVGESISFLKEIDDEKERIELIEEFERKQEQSIETKDLVQKASNFLTRHSKTHLVTKNGQADSSSFKDELNKFKKERSKQLEEVRRKGLNKHE